MAAETLRVTTAGSWQRGTKLNLERSLRLGDELGGHLVSGHVDGIAELLTREDLPDMARLFLRVPVPLSRFIAPKGSAALDGVSLTVNEVAGDTFSVLLIPHTLQVTTFGEPARRRTPEPGSGPDGALRRAPSANGRSMIPKWEPVFGQDHAQNKEI